MCSQYDRCHMNHIFWVKRGIYTINREQQKGMGLSNWDRHYSMTAFASQTVIQAGPARSKSAEVSSEIIPDEWCLSLKWN